jgi:hypothetical protein
MQVELRVAGPPAIKVPIVLEIQTHQQTSMPSPSATPKEGDDHIGGISSGDLLTLIVALAAYVAAVRFFLAERLSDLEEEPRSTPEALVPPYRGPATDEGGREATVEKDKEIKPSSGDRKKNLQDAINRLVIADFLFVLAAVLLCWRLFVPLQIKPAPWMISSLFTVAILYLGYLHAREWRRHPRYHKLRNWRKKTWRALTDAS